MATTTQPFTGTYVSDPIHSSFGFAARYMGVSTYRGTLDYVTATLIADESGVRLEGTAKVESISIRTPEQFRAHVLSDEFFGAERFPEVEFRSTGAGRGGGGTAPEEGELTTKGITKPLTPKGPWAAPAPDAFGNPRGHLALEATVNRRDYEFT